MFEDKIQIHFEAAGLAGLLKEAGADFEIADGNQVLDCVITVPLTLKETLLLFQKFNSPEVYLWKIK